MKLEFAESAGAAHETLGSPAGLRISPHPSWILGRPRSRRRSLLELNVSSLSDWPIAYRRIAFHYDAAANRIKVVGELLPNNGVTPQTDAALLSAWETATCTQAGVPLERLIENELSLVREQKASRGTLLGWLYEGLGEWCKSCQAKMYEHGGRYQDEDYSNR